VTVSLDLLDEEALVRILSEPKSALVRQYKRLFELDGVQLEFEEEALRAIARKAIERNTGARGLRAIMESIIMDLMYRVPSDDTIESCVVTKEMVEDQGEPRITYGEKAQPKKGLARK